MSEQQGREVITLAEAAKFIGRTYGVKPSVATVWRWAKKGLAGVRLATIRIGRRYRTTTTSVREFIERQSQAESPRTGENTPGQSPKSSFTAAQIAEARRQREAEIAKAKARLRQFSLAKCGKSKRSESTSEGRGAVTRPTASPSLDGVGSGESTARPRQGHVSSAQPTEANRER